MGLGTNMSLPLPHKFPICMHGGNFITHEHFVSHLLKISFSATHIPTSQDEARWFNIHDLLFSWGSWDFALDVSPSMTRVAPSLGVVQSTLTLYLNPESRPSSSFYQTFLTLPFLRKISIFFLFMLLSPLRNPNHPFIFCANGTQECFPSFILGLLVVGYKGVFPKPWSF